MKTAEYFRYGPPDVLQITERERPVPDDDQILIKVHATTVLSGDCHLRKGIAPGVFTIPLRLNYGVLRPRDPLSLGGELAGEVESVGKNVTRFKAGDAVYAGCVFGPGTYADYICLSEKSAVTAKPAGLSFAEAAAIPFGAMSALYFLQIAGIQKGQNVLVYGASGSVGTAAVQLARHFGARVTGVCSTANLELVKSLGAQEVIDYTNQDFTGSNGKFDIIFDTVGKAPLAKSKSVLTVKGVFISAVAGFALLGQMILTFLTSKKKIMTGVGKEKYEYLDFISALIEKGKFRAVIDKQYPLEQIAEAHAYVQKGHKKGNVVITFGL